MIRDSRPSRDDFTRESFPSDRSVVMHDSWPDPEVIYGIARRRLTSLGLGHADCDDLAQEVQIIVNRNYDRNSPLENFVNGVVSYTVIGHRRRQRRRPVELNEIDPAAPQVDIDARLDAALLLDKVRACLETLPEDVREAFLLRIAGGLSVPEVARISDVPVSTLRPRLRRNHESVLKCLRKKDYKV